jgi:uncharacterized Ntn-hydrolase superfamily protein
LTYSIVARDDETAELGVAVQSHWFSVGSVVPWARAGVGAVATQSMVEISYGPLGLELMASGKKANEALEALLRSDMKRETRQVAFVDAEGNAGVHTGKNCTPYAGHFEGDGFTCEANLMRNDSIWGSMAKSFKATSKISGGKRMPLAERLVAALEAAEESGGDIRGRQSAAIVVVSQKAYPNSWSGRLVDLRVEDSQTPLRELKRLLRIQRGYEWANKGDQYLNDRSYRKAFLAYKKANELVPEQEELEFWQAVTLVHARKVKDAKLIFGGVFRKNKDWIHVAKSLPKVGILPKNKRIMRAILSS